MTMILTAFGYFLVASAVVGFGWLLFDEVRLKLRERAEPGYLDRVRAEMRERFDQSR